MEVNVKKLDNYMVLMMADYHIVVRNCKQNPQTCEIPQNTGVCLLSYIIQITYTQLTVTLLSISIKHKIAHELLIKMLNMKQTM